MHLKLKIVQGLKNLSKCVVISSNQIYLNMT